MPKNSRYPIPARLHRVEQELERSRFITTVAPAPTVEEAKAFIARVREEFPDANHNCWAYVVGPPGSTGMAGMSDDGEPHGTAGRPMLTALLHGNVGDVAVVVTRSSAERSWARAGWCGPIPAASSRGSSTCPPPSA
ncbi:MAG TPA: YigZ family protein [Archangium sp.]|uniref:IMPACT family protein n=1 Tax=Archangium sp. TaxID=1872627 RepID=UPI002E34920A|nr:YigZ family protein [Archangium sp.]HEX5751256.1 YigZ family protein [Archangium sp.]